MTSPDTVRSIAAAVIPLLSGGAVMAVAMLWWLERGRNTK